MTDHVIDLIDNVIDQHGDAMRWSPDADPVPEPEHVWHEWFGVILTDWQYTLVNQLMSDELTLTLDNHGRFTPTGEAYYPSPAVNTVDGYVYVIDECIHYWQSLRRRRSALHSAYRRRRR